MSFNVEYIYQIRDRFSRQLNKFNEMTRKVQGTVQRASAKVERFQKALKGVGEKARSVGTAMSAAITLPLVAFATSTVMAAAKIESLTVNFESLLGSASAAADMMFKLQKFSAATPFQLEGIAQTARMLLGFGVASGDIIDRLKMLGDVAAGTGRTMSEIGLIFGQIKAKGKLQGEELLQLAERGIPILATLAENMGKTQPEIQKMITAGKIGFPIVLQAFRKMTNEGGVFANQMEKQSTTLGGLFSTLKDNFFLAQSEIGRTLVEVFDLKTVLRGLISNIQAMTLRIRSFVQENPRITKVILSLTAIAAAAGPVVVAFGALSAAIGALSVPVLAVIASIGILAGSFARWYQKSHPILETINSISKSMRRFTGVFGDALKLDFSTLDLVAGIFDRIGHAINVVLTPMAAWLRLASGMVETMTKLTNFEFSAALDSITKTFGDVGDIVGRGFDSVGGVFTGGDSKEIANERAKKEAAKVDVSGKIDVSASGGAQLNTVDILLNRGNNLAYTK